MFCYNHELNKFVNVIASDGDKYLAYLDDKGDFSFSKACYFYKYKFTKQTEIERKWCARMLLGRRKSVKLMNYNDFWKMDFNNKE